MHSQRGNATLATWLAAVAAIISIAALVIALRAPAPSREASETLLPPVKQDRWITGGMREGFDTVERHLRGLDVAMMEIGYRFNELYFAGQDRNWDYAKYQAEKIELALRLAIERRPKRAASSQPFLNVALPALHQAVASRDARQFTAAMDQLKTGCMKCHTDESVPHFIVEFPRTRTAPLGSGR